MGVDLGGSLFHPLALASPNSTIDVCSIRLLLIVNSTPAILKPVHPFWQVVDSIVESLRCSGALARLCSHFGENSTIVSF